MRNLILVLGDQLDRNSAALDDFDCANDAIWMAECAEEITYVWSHQIRIAFFLSAMRHFRDEQRQIDRTVHYHELSRDAAADRGRSFSELLSMDLAKLDPERVIYVQPGDLRVQETLKDAIDSAGIELSICEDRHFYCSVLEFEAYAKGRKGLRLEYFYREMRKRHDVLMEDGGPVEGQWNFDHDNRESFGRKGPSEVPSQKLFPPDEVTLGVFDVIRDRFLNHPGSLDHFQLPVTNEQAVQFLNHFVAKLLPEFGRYEDAMWSDEAFLYHSRLSVLLNVKLISPRDCVNAAVAAYQAGDAAINSVEGFVRQILGWREFVRGIYWLKMPEYVSLNHLHHQLDLPSFFWDGQTQMNCVKHSMQHVLNHSYSHHIHRLMVLGNFAQLWGADPKAFHDWHMAMYVDAIDWVSLPNTLGMSQYGDGGIVGTKPYCSSGNYINKMSNFCGDCQFNYKKRTGDDACPFTTLYWEFMDRHYDLLKDNARMKFPMKNLERMRQNNDDMQAIRDRAQELRELWG